MNIHIHGFLKQQEPSCQTDKQKNQVSFPASSTPQKNNTKTSS